MSEETPIEQNAIEEQLKKLQNQNTTLYRELNSQKRKIETLTQQQNTHNNSIQSVQSDMLNNASTIDNLTNILNGLKQTSESHETQIKNLLNHVQNEVKSIQQNIQGVKETHNAHKQELASQLQQHNEKIQEVQTQTEKAGEAVKVVANTVQTTQEQAKPQVTETVEGEATVNQGVAETVEGEADADADLRLNDAQKSGLENYNKNSGLMPISEDAIIDLIKKHEKTIINVKLSENGFFPDRDSGYKIGTNGENNGKDVMFTKYGWFKDTDNINVVPSSYINDDIMGRLELNFKNDTGVVGNAGNFINNITNTGSGLMDGLLRSTGFRKGGKTRRKNKKQKRKSIKKHRKSRK